MTFFIVGETPQGYVNSCGEKSQVIFLDENLRRNKQRKSWIQQPQKSMAGANIKPNYLMQNPSEIIDFRGILVRVERLELSASRSQSARATNCAIPGYLIFGFSSFLLSVVIPVVRCNFEVFSKQWSKPTNAHVPTASGVLPLPAPDTVPPLPNQARYQLRYTRIFAFQFLGISLSVVKAVVRYNFEVLFIR